jgi:predicted ATPase
MRYTFFEIENFKGIRHLRLDLNGPPKGPIQTLVGLNESGKTTILEAIDYFSKGNEDLGPKELAGRLRPDVHDLIPIAERANFNGEIIVKAGLELDTTDVEHLKKVLHNRHQYRFRDVVRTFEVWDRYTFSNSIFQRHRITWTLRVTGRPPRVRQERQANTRTDAEVWGTATSFLTTQMPPIWYFPDFLFEFPRRIYLSESPADTDSDRFYRALLQDIISAVDPNASVEEHILRRARADNEPDKLALDQLLLEMGRRVTNDIFTAWDRIFKRNIGQKSVRLRIATDETRGHYIYFQIEDSDGYFFVHERSLGFRWFFVFLLLTIFRGFRTDSPENLMFLLDEPASNLHPTAQEELLVSLERLGESSAVIYTTHSRYLINPNWLENTYVVRNRGIEAGLELTDYHARKTDIVVERYRTFAAQHPDQSYYFQPILEVLDYVPSKLELVPDIIMVGGKNDFYTLRYMNDLILKLGLNLHFLPGGGAGSLDEVIRLYIGWARNFIVLLDSDGEGTTQTRRYVEKFGSVVNGRIFTLGDFVPEVVGKSLERAFEKSDREAIQSLAFPGQAYRKNKFYRALQEALVTNTSVAITEDAKSRFAGLLKGLNEKLESLR